MPARDSDYSASDSDSDAPLPSSSRGAAAASSSRGAAAGASAAAAPAGAARGTRGAVAAGAKAKKKGKGKDAGYAWEATFKRSWDAVREDGEGGLEATVRGMLEAGKRRRTRPPAYAVQRGIIRHLVLVLDLSESMSERDLRPNRHALSLQYAREFVSEYFDQNPIGQLGIIATRDGIAERLGLLGGNVVDHLAALSNARRLEPKGEPSLQNALEMARSSLAHLPASSSREILVLFGSLTTCDPSNIHTTIDTLAEERIRVSMVCLAAEVKVCKTVTVRTGGTFAVALNEGHLRDVLFQSVAPPEILAPKRSAAQAEDAAPDGGDLLCMAFPLRLPASAPASLCACHGRLKSGTAFVCPRCEAKVCDVPTDCPICGVTIVLSTHLARSYHHLFPTPYYAPVEWDDLDATEDVSPTCHGCSTPFAMDTPAARAAAVSSENVSPTGRYACEACGEHFCIECDTFVHETLHLCPGCA